jgi:GTPase SAR1 family protein
MPIAAIFVGPAGSGKTTLVYKYGRWLKRYLFLKTAIVNLDPGAENILYKPTFDIRDIFTLQDIMRKYGLGPNGAFLKASELIAENIDEIMKYSPFDDLDRWDIVLIDTPGQMEAFIFRRASNIFFEALNKIMKPVIVFVIDASAIDTLADTVTLWFLHVLVQVKTGLIVVPVINKIDIAPRIDYVKTLVENPEDLMKAIRKEVEEGLLSDIAPDLLSIAVKTKAPVRPVLVSATSQDDFTELHTLVHEAYCA